MGYGSCFLYQLYRFEFVGLGKSFSFDCLVQIKDFTPNLHPFLAFLSSSLTFVQFTDSGMLQIVMRSAEAFVQSVYIMCMCECDRCALV